MKQAKYQLLIGLTCFVSGYRPTFQCQEPLGNISTLQTNALETFRFDKCSIESTVNVSGNVSVSSTQCIHGMKYLNEDGSNFAREKSIISEVKTVFNMNEYKQFNIIITVYINN